MRDATPLIFTAMITSVFLILFIVLVLTRVKTFALRLILIGVFVAIAGALQGNISAVTIDPGQAAISFGSGTGSLMKIATILILSGVAFEVLDRTSPAAAAEPKEASRGL